MNRLGINKVVATSVMFLSLASAQACVVPVEEEESAPTAEAESDLMASPGGLWPGSPAVIPVCWEPTQPSLVVRTWIEEVVQGQWGRYGRLIFTGWGECSVGTPGIHVRDTAAWAEPEWRTLGGYTQLKNGLADGLRIDSSTTCAGYATAEHCIKALALHEFGHALGFYHEENRPEYTGDRCGNSAVSGGLEYGAYDIDSVMSYKGQASPTCASLDPNGIKTWKDTLSANDITAVQSAYHRRIPGQLVSMSGKCLSTNSSSNGSWPFTWACDEAGGARGDQVWDRLTGGEIASAGRGVCLDLTSGNTANGTRVQNWSCLDNVNQHWTLENVAIRGWGGKCLDLPSGNLVSGQKLQMYSCLGDWTDRTQCPTTGACLGRSNDKNLSNANQKWSLTDSGEIRFGGLTSSWCVTAASTTNGSNPTIAACNGSNTQKFDLTDGQITLRNNSAKCLDVQGPLASQYLAGVGGPINGGVPQVFDCMSQQLNQTWWVTGPVQYGTSGKIIRRAIETDGYSPSLFTRSSPLPASDEWDYHW